MAFWLKTEVGAPSNPKWRMIAIKARCMTGHVWSLYTWMLDFAKAHDGSLAGFDLEEVAAGTDYPLEELQRIWDAFIAKAIVIGDQLRNWVTHQGAAAIEASHAAAQATARALSTSAERMRRKRQRDHELARQGEMFASHQASQASHPPVTCDASADLPPAPPSREYIKNTPCSPPGGTARSARMQIVPRAESRQALQGEILLPMAGRRPRRLTAREQRQAEFRETAFRVAMELEAEARGVAA